APAQARPAPPPAMVEPVSTPAPAPSPALAPTSAPQPPAAPQAAVTAPPAAPLDIEQQRAEVAAAVSTLADVDRAAWSTESTLEVFLSTIQDDPFGRICPLVERYDDLAASRIQLTPPRSEERRVGKECR